jgi:hypothetical protein
MTCFWDCVQVRVNCQYHTSSGNRDVLSRFFWHLDTKEKDVAIIFAFGNHSIFAGVDRKCIRSRIFPSIGFSHPLGLAWSGGHYRYHGVWFNAMPVNEMK